MHRRGFTQAAPFASGRWHNPPYDDSGGFAEPPLFEHIIETTTETITETTTTVDIFQVPEAPRRYQQPNRTQLGLQLLNHPFRWTNLPMELEDDLLSAAPDAVSVISSDEEATNRRIRPLTTVSICESDDDMDIDNDVEEEPNNINVSLPYYEIPQHLLEDICTAPVLQDSYWLEGCNDEPPAAVAWQVDQIECESDTTEYYKNFFLARNHYNLVGQDSKLGSVLLSFTTEQTLSKQNHIRVMLWLETGTIHNIIPTAHFGPDPKPLKLAQQLNEQMDIERFVPVVFPEASNMIASFEEESKINKYDFNIFYQQETECTNGKTSRTSAAFKEFLNFLGQRVEMRDRTIVFTIFNDKDIQFQVSTNSSECAPRATIVFQESNFASAIIESNSMHALITLQPLNSNTRGSRYRVSVAARQPSVIQKTPELREYILMKLINAENAHMARTTRAPLLQKLVAQLEKKTRDFLGADSGRTSDVPQDSSSWQSKQLQFFLSDHCKLMRWANWMKTQISSRDSHAADRNGETNAWIEEYQNRISVKFSKLQHFGAELLRINNQASFEIQRQIEPLQALASQEKNSLLRQIAQWKGTSRKNSPLADTATDRDTVNLTINIEKEAHEDQREPPNEELIYHRLVAAIEEESNWINEKKQWLNELVVENSVNRMTEKHDEFMTDFFTHRDRCKDIFYQGRQLTDNLFSEAMSQLYPLLNAEFDLLQKLATKQLVHSLMEKTSYQQESVDSLSVSNDSGISSADSTLQSASSPTPLQILDSLTETAKVDRKHLWTTCIGMKRAWQYNSFLFISEVTLAQIIEIVGFFLDHVASLVRSGSDPDKLTKDMLEECITGEQFRFFKEDRPRGKHDLNTLIHKRAAKERFLKSFPRKTKISNEASQLVHLLTLDFVMYLRTNVRKVLAGSYVTLFEHIDKGLRTIGYGFLIRPEAAE